jgi:Transposase IS200 like
MLYRGFPAKLYHAAPYRVEPGAVFHVRVALDRETQQPRLTDPALGRRLLDSARFYESRRHWHSTLFLLMPDHLHTLLSFARDQAMSSVIEQLETFSRAQTRHRMARRLFRSSPAQR